MKKIILTTALAVLTAPAFAQVSIYESFDTRQVSTGTWNFLTSVAGAIQRAVSSDVKLVPWVKMVKEKRHRVNTNGPLGTSFYGFPARTFKQGAITHRPDLYNKRMRAYQNMLKGSHTLNHYTFNAPRPTDLTGMTNTQATFLANFLLQSADEKKFDKRYTPVVTDGDGAEVKLTFTVEGKKMILLINCRSKQVYFFLNNIPGKAQPQAKPRTATHPSRNLQSHPRADYSGVIWPNK